MPTLMSPVCRSGLAALAIFSAGLPPTSTAIAASSLQENVMDRCRSVDPALRETAVVLSFLPDNRIVSLHIPVSSFQQDVIRQCADGLNNLTCQKSWLEFSFAAYEAVVGIKFKAALPPTSKFALGCAAVGGVAGFLAKRRLKSSLAAATAAGTACAVAKPLLDIGLCHRRLSKLRQTSQKLSWPAIEDANTYPSRMRREIKNAQRRQIISKAEGEALVEEMKKQTVSLDAYIRRAWGR